ncbi:FAD:protein FMN transferase [Pontibacter sp. JAM-7]|uniref:FAD:protein FMN transferase n=1 Tax=Pontibacter sp. JAM-7 TaxID=3366581 RepID=UPI003AF832EC
MSAITSSLMILAVKHRVSEVFSHHRQWPAALLLAILFLLVTACADTTPPMQVHSGITMGTTFSVKWIGVDGLESTEIARRIDSALVAINQSMSTYISDSELSVINQQPAGSAHQVSAELGEVLALSLEVGAISEGAFDITVGPLVNLWGFGPNGRVLHAPSEDQIATVRPQVGFHKLQYDVNTRVLTRVVKSYIDLSAVAKGYGVDYVAEILEKAGISDYLVEIGGELRARGSKPNGQPWRIAIETPTAEFERSVQRILAVRDVSIATSGDYRNYFEDNGVRFSHTIDPATAAPIDHRLASVTVLMPTCAEADALATTLMVMGPDKGMAFANEQGIKIFMLVKTDTGFEERMSPGFEQYLVQ